ncbi:hypothetical protein LTR70_001057 [Exophiala xenobiotica]|uniref:Uncharacterized protein n=1 Tax=Lithohypha guttulata TaxID=1690604 RepID=A0ABR0KMV1_9EURO|nr:hypothetical protein LTR24_000754 [Lithohypha guttulata]KAK5328903.1 hypothetical protein LTR70_001057 [Exophiala xenobiotica]
MSMQSSVGNHQVYEDGDQRVPPDSQKSQSQQDPYEEGKKNSHKDNDPKDQRSIGNRLAAAHDQNDTSSSGKGDKESKAAQQDATLPAKMHGNQPSRGAQIDADIQAEEEEMLAKKDAAKGGSGKGGTGKMAGQKN